MRAKVMCTTKGRRGHRIELLVEDHEAPPIPLPGKWVDVEIAVRQGDAVTTESESGPFWIDIICRLEKLEAKLARYP